MLIHILSLEDSKEAEFVSNQIKRNDITTMYEMFKGCIGLKEINFEQFNTENVRDMNSMFSECFCLKKINLKQIML